ncbi:hypothetical protein TWF696_009616 [Orbilia brochopaga]|uniref:F-box domain-containing protein n=1 Tax=Orbilia brochopaga TaxID=3140254 RepID=A0AAV9UCQ5_9PEZI
MSPLALCGLCGTAVFPRRPSEPIIMSHIRTRFLHCDNGIPYVSTLGRIANPHGDHLEPETVMPGMRQYVRLGARITRAGGELSREYDGTCYPIHNSCWLIFHEIARNFGLHSGLLEPPYISDEGDWISLIYSLFDTAPYDEYLLLWPHEYCAPGGTRALRGHAQASEQAWRQRWGRRRWSLDNQDPSDITKRIKLPLRFPEKLEALKDHFGMFLHSQLQTSEVLSVPYIFPLPVELMLKILSCLRGSDLLAFAAIDCGARPRLEVPDSLWQAQFGPRGEVWHTTRDGLYENMEGLSALTRFLITHGDLGTEPIRKLRRVCDISLTMLDVVSDVRNGEICNVEGVGGDSKLGSDVQGEHWLAVELEAQENINGSGTNRCIGVQTLAAGRVGPFQATGVFVCYAGSGAMRFVSGLQFLPGGEKIGLVNTGDQSYLCLCATTADAAAVDMVLWTASNEYGIRDLTVAKTTERPCWRPSPQMTRFQGRGIRLEKAGVEVAEVSIGIDVWKMTRFAIKSRNFTRLWHLTNMAGAASVPL